MQVPVAWRSVFLFWIGAALIVSPFLFFPLLDGATSYYDNQRLIEISCVMLALVIISLRLIKGASFHLLFSRPIALMLGLFFLLGLVSSGLAHSPRHALFEWTNLLLLLGMAWLVACEVHAGGDAALDTVLMLCGFACALYLLFEIAIYITVLKAGVQPIPRLFFWGFDNQRFFNHAQTVSLPLLGLLATRQRDPGRQALGWTITALWWMLLFVSAGRGTFVGLTTGLAMVWLSMHTSAAAWCRSMALAGLAGLAACLFFYAAIPLMMGLEPFGFFFSTASRTIENPASARLELWARALDMIHANPWLGAGPAHFAHVARDLQIAAHPHNWALQIGSEWGLPALSLLSAVLALAMWKLWQLRKSVPAKDQETLTVWLVTGWAVLVDGLVSGLIVSPTSQLLIALYAGCAWGWAHSLSPSHQTIGYQPSIAGRALVILTALMMMYALVQGVRPELKAQRIPKDPNADMTLRTPRILLNGRF